MAHIETERESDCSAAEKNATECKQRAKDRWAERIRASSGKIACERGCHGFSGLMRESDCSLALCLQFSVHRSAAGEREN